MSGCRGGAILGGPSICGGRVLEDEEADELGVGRGKWCRDCAEPLIRVKAQMGTRTRTAAPRLPAPKPEPKRRYATDAEKALMAWQLAAMVKAHGSIGAADAAEALGVTTDSRIFRAARDQATANGWIRRAARRGYVVGEKPVHTQFPDDQREAPEDPAKALADADRRWRQLDTLTP